MKKELLQLRQEMAKENIDAYMIPTTDYHGSEYVNDYFKERAFVSGFTGSAGTLVVTMDEAKLWTDGRYFIQCAMQIDGSGIDLMKMNDKETPSINDYLASKLSKDNVLGFDGRVVSYEEGMALEEVLSDKGIKISENLDLVDRIWKTRPQIKPSKIYPLPLSVTGKESDVKIREVQEEMEKNGADYNLITNLEEIAWLLNLRGADVDCTPVFFAFALMSQTDLTIYLYKEALDPSLINKHITVKEYMEIGNDLGRLPSGITIWSNETQANYAFMKRLPKGTKVIKTPNPIEMMKGIKNPVEIESTRNAHIKDGVAVTKFLYWIKNNIGKIPMTEISVSDYLLDLRKAQDGWFDLSFPTIAGYNDHGAIVHYEATPETDKVLIEEGLLLVDSGAQYNDGTTDITRTIALGPLTDQMKEYYTAVLASHIILSTAKFKPGTRGIELDTMTRKPLKDKGLDYNHGTGHGVGHILSVHEWPNNISPRSGECLIVPGMITSDEPGVYIEGEFGIRLENEILCVEDKGMYSFKPLTFVPFDRDAILPKELTKEQLDYLNQYHETVFEKISPLLEPDEKNWLRQVTSPL